MVPHTKKPKGSSGLGAACPIEKPQAGHRMFRPWKGKDLEKAVSQLGLVGLKIHPSQMGIRPDDLSVMPILRKAADMGIPVMIHSNPWGPGFYETSSPQYIDHIARIFPDLTIVMAHIGGTRFLDTAKMTGLNIWVETSGGLDEIAQIFGIRTAERVLRKMGLNRAIYGTDFPMSAKPQLQIINKMRLKKEEKDKLLHQNAESIFFRQS
jgi:predicted TIM-barrel fold metal-dependent hydrolase